MKLQNKLVFYNSLSKIIIILSIGLTLPSLVQQVIFNHTDARLKLKRDKILALIKKGGISEISNDEDCSFSNYNILKEEYILVEPLKRPFRDTLRIENAKRDIEGDIITQRVLSEPFFYDHQFYLLEIGRDLTTIQELNTRIRHFTLLTLIVVVGISILLDFGFIRLTLVPFNKIVRNKLKGVNHPTGFDLTPIHSSTHDFRMLDQSLNEMMVKIKYAFLVEKEFIANVSHELLTPISVLQNRLENILLDYELEEAVAEKMVDSLKTLNRLTKIIKALLMISKIENDQYLKSDTVSLNEVLDEVIGDIEERLTEKEIALKKDFADHFRMNNCNRTLLYHLFFNIINNAIKYNKTGGEIIVSSFPEEGAHVVEIADSGIGIELSQIDSIWNRFKKLNDDSESHGLGLPIVKTIANFHNIEVQVRSEKNKGSVFKLIFK